MNKNKVTPRAHATPSESRIQQEIVMWYRNTYCLEHHSPRCMIFSIPNEGRGAASAQLIQTGLYPGVADLCVIHIYITDEDPFSDDEDKLPHYEVRKFIFIEVKTENGYQSRNQNKFEYHCKSMNIPYYIVRSLDEFKKIIVGL